MVRVLTITAEAKVGSLELFRQKHEQFRSEYKLNIQMAVCDRCKFRSISPEIVFFMYNSCAVE
jgi:predicted transposase YdaD